MPAQELHIRLVAIDTWRENVAYLLRDCAMVRAITSPAGTAGTMAVLAEVELPFEVAARDSGYTLTTR